MTTPPADTVIDQVLAHINAARTANGLTPYVLNANLSKAAAAHNALMVGGCGLSHQCPGEAGLGDRFTAAGVSWNSAGENIGQGNAAANTASIVAAANGLTDLMLAEVPPNDGHRRNLLNPGFKRIGLAVTRGSDGRVWVTQDFVN
ncbi:CAP domain-containing protein [Actinoplanes sp. M2I2]|uniref:CAP domain-containing protein n=1 Tax=Actinoplanes sp. M2I2 TaxID=1734444 RepID=UPI00202102F1|nr:CAP domain-containing protein [Actinoplanes sp. M2I2]